MSLMYNASRSVMFDDFAYADSTDPPLAQRGWTVTTGIGAINVNQWFVAGGLSSSTARRTYRLCVDYVYSRRTAC